MSVNTLTFGEIQFQVQKRHPGLDVDIAQSFINERYRRAARRIPWQRRKVQSHLATVAEYTTGTVGVTLGSAAIIGALTVWTTGMTGRRIRFNGENAFYTFTYVSGTTGTLDRAYEGASDTDATYSIWKNVFLLPADCQQLQSIRVSDVARDLDQISAERMDEVAGNRLSTGNPLSYAPYQDDASTPQRQQVEVYPVPIEVGSLPFWYIQEPMMFDIADTASYFPTWMNPDALYSGVAADVCGREKDYAGKESFEGDYLRSVNEMLAAECARMPEVQIQMEDRFTRHRGLRGVARRFPFELP